MEPQHLHLDQEVEIEVVFAACQIAMLNVAKQTDMTDMEHVAFASAHDVVSRFLHRLDQRGRNAWKKETVKVVSEMLKEPQNDGRDSKGHTANGHRPQ